MLHRPCALTLTLATLAFGLPGSSGSADSSIQAIQDRLERFTREERLYNVVRISGVDGDGYGLIIGRNFENLLVLTARHILHDDFVNGSQGPGASLTARLYGIENDWRGIPGQVYVLTQTDRVQDIAVIQVSVPRDSRLGEGNYLLYDPWREKVVDARPEDGARIELAATVNDIGYAGMHARIRRSEHDFSLSFEGLVGDPGQSGAPIATDRGFVAIYLGSGARQATLLIDIRDALIAEFGAPFWGLIPVDPLPQSTLLCLRLGGAHVTDVTVSGPFGEVVLDERGCGGTNTGLHSIFGKRYGLVCTPGSFRVTTASSEPFAVNCYIDPSGMWSTSGQGFLHLETVESGQWRLTLSLPRNGGQIEGMVTGSPPKLFLNEGLFRGRTPVSGSIVVKGSELNIDLSTGSEFFEGVYSR